MKDEKSENLISAEEIRAFSASEPLLHRSFQLDHLQPSNLNDIFFERSSSLAGNNIRRWFVERKVA